MMYHMRQIISKQSIAGVFFFLSVPMIQISLITGMITMTVGACALLIKRKPQKNS